MAEREQVSDNLPDLQLRAIERFGLTTDPHAARFIFNDGSSIPTTTGKFQTHLDVGVISPDEEPYEVFRAIMISGAIRFRRMIRGDDLTIIQFFGFPNRQQRFTLKRLVKGTDRMNLEFTDFSTNSRVLDEHIKVCPSASSITSFLAKVDERLLQISQGNVSQPEFG